MASTRDSSKRLPFYAPFMAAIVLLLMWWLADLLLYSPPPNAIW